MKKFLTLYFVIFVSFASLLAQPLPKQTEVIDTTTISPALLARKDYSAAFMAAVADYSSEDYAKAKDKFAALHELYPDDDAVCYYLGMSECFVNELEAAEMHLSSAVASDSTNVWYLYALSNLYNATGQYHKYGDIGDKLVKMSLSARNSPYTLSLVANAKFYQRRYAESEKYFRQALDLEPGYIIAQMGIIQCLGTQNKVPQFLLAIEEFILNEAAPFEYKLSTLEPIISGMNSRIYQLYGEQIFRLIDLCKAQHPDKPEIYMLKVREHLMKGEYDKASEQCYQLAEVAAKVGDKFHEAEAYSIAGDIYYEQGDMRSTFRCYDKVLKINPEHLTVLNNYAYYLSTQKRQLKKAKEMSAKTVELDPDNASFLDTYGWILYLMRRPAEAKPYFKRAMLYGGKDSAVVLEHYSIVLDALGEKDLATYYRNLAAQKAEK